MTRKSSVPTDGKKAPAPENPMAALKLSTPSLNAVKAALPTYSAYAEDAEDKKRRRSARGPQLGDQALQHAEDKAEAERTAARRAARNKKRAEHGELGYVDKVSELRRIEDIAQSGAAEVNSSVDAIAADLARFTQVIDKRAEWTPIATLATPVLLIDNALALKLLLGRAIAASG